MSTEIDIKKFRKTKTKKIIYQIYKSNKSLKRNSWYLEKTFSTLEEVAFYFKGIDRFYSYESDYYKYRIVQVNSEIEYSPLDAKQLFLLRIEHGF